MTRRAQARPVEAARSDREQLASLLEHVPVGVLAAEADSRRVVFGSAEVDRLLRHAVPEGSSIDEWCDALGFRSDGHRLTRSEWPLARTLEGVEVPPEDVLYERGDGTCAWFRVHGAPIRDREGRVTGGVVAFYDVDRERRAVKNLEFLADASRLLAESLDPELTLARVGRLAASKVASYCIFDVIDETGELRRVAVAHRDPDREAILRAPVMLPPRIASAHPIARALMDGRPLVLDPFGPEDWRRIARSPEHLALIERLAPHSVMFVPMWMHDRPLGLLILAASAPEPGFREEDVGMAKELAWRAAAALEHARLYRDAQEAVRARDEFLSVASHELRTPITALSLKLQTLARTCAQQDGAPARGTADLEGMRAQVKRLADLVDELLDVSRIQADRLALQTEPIELASMVSEVVARMRSAAGRVGCEIEVDAHGQVVIEGERLRLERVVTNLLANALKYGAGRPIEVRVARADGRATIRVRDHGIGIERHSLERIFGKFERAVSERQYGGLGLGLFISRRIVEAHGGTIRAESSPGEGATFVVELPLA